MDLQTKRRYKTWKRWKIGSLIAIFLLLVVVAAMHFLNRRGTNHEGDRVVIGAVSKNFPDPAIAFLSSAVGGNFPVFLAPYAEEWEEILFPQYAEVLNERGNWLEVSIDGRNWWVDTAFVPSLDEITEVFLAMGDHTSFYFHNIETGFRYGFNSDRPYVGASVGKVFYAHFLYAQDELGIITLTEQERLWVEYTLRMSLDEFSHNLTEHFGVVAYNDWLGEQGIYTLQTPHRHFGQPTNLTASEAATLMYNIYHYFLTETANAVEFRENMVNNQTPFIVSDHYEVASKTGWIFVWELVHDVAIVEAPSPYILVILTENSRLGGTGDHLHYFEQFSALFEAFNRTWFVME